MLSFKTLGDTHLGRRFRTGVPLHRVGDREEMVWAQFEHELNSVGRVDLHIHVGDLFDKFIVPPEIVLRAVGLYQAAAIRRPDVRFVILEGNHDVSRDTLKASSFDLFEALVAGVENITLVRTKGKVIGNYGFIPYTPFRPTAELVAQLPDKLTEVFGHFDIQDWGGDNVIPTALLAEKGIFRATSGHDHLPRTEKRNGVTITVTGSMQPYSHAEDPDGLMYLTLPLAQLDTRDLKNMNVRVVLQDGEFLPADLNCLSLTSKRLMDNEEITVDTSEIETLDLRGLLFNALEGLSIRDQIMGAFQND